MLSTTSSNNRSHFSYGRNGQASQAEQTITTTGSFDFLPSVSFDDLHTSIESAASGSDFRRNKYPSPAASRSDLESSLSMADRRMSDKTAANSNGSATRVGIPASSSRTTRSGSILHRPSASRQNSASSISTTSGSVDASTATIGVRTRRQSQYPPVSGSNATAKPPRKSIGPGVVADAETVTRSASKRRPSLFSERTSDVTRSSLDIGSDTTRSFTTTTRSVKAKSVQQPSPMVSQTNILAGTSLTPEQHPTASKSPLPGGKGLTPSSGRRASIMPTGHASHATGLGARTISPTDTRRMKRMSMMPQSMSLNQVSNVPPPPPVSMETRAASRSPSMIPRKASATPSSSRTTPDISRKSYSSGLSVGSTVSFNTVRTSTGSLQPRLSQSSSVSRLPAPKHTTTHGSLPSGDEEEVPPVPAIPKLFESPKDTPGETYFLAKKKSSLGTLDSISINLSNNNSTASVSVPAQVETVKLQRKPSVKTTAYAPAMARNDDKKNTQNKKSLEPLRLPPLNLGPLSIPTAAKVAALQEQGKVDRNMSPPASRQLPKTPTTPMTASKSSFFAKTRYDETIEPLPPIRSSTSAHRSHRRTPSPPDATTSSSDSSLVFKDLDPKSNMSPFLSSSLPKNNTTHGYLKRSKTGSEHSHVSRTLFDEKTPQKPAGPRPPNTDKPVPKSPPPAPPADQPQTPSSMSTLRRKLSLSWKKGNSKGAIVPPQDVVDKAQGLKHESIPTPRIPASATLNSLPTAKHSSQNASGPQLLAESKRRKSSATSMNNTYVSHDRTKSDPWSAKKDVTAAVDVSTMPPARHPSVMAKLMRPKTSSSAMPSSTSYVAEVDKDDVIAEEEMRKLGSRRKETEIAARTLDALKKRASPKERVGPHEAIRIAMLNIYERGEIIDYNDVYFCGTQNANKVVGDLSSDAPNFGYDDERGDYSIVIGDHLAYRYEVIDVLGKGSFGQVVRCIDHKLGVLVAVKIIRNKKRFHQQALVEVNILQKLREWDPHNRHSMVNFTQSFYFRGHLCISTELLDMNLYEFIKAHSFRGFSLRIIRRFTKQILSSLIILKQKKVIHCDLKPENILLRHPLHAEIKVIDFGSSCFESEKVYTYIQSRFYRSPEVILGMTYGLPIDMWSVGCILAELYTGVPIFPGENEQEQLACIMEVFGPPEKHLIEKSTRKKLFFDSMGKPRLTVSSKGRRRRPSSKSLQQVLKCDDEAFLDFVARCLRWDPDRRLKPEDAVRHEFITGIKVPTPIPRMPMREASPVKRHNTISVSRPLPDPPGISSKTNVGASPGKPVHGSTRRASGATAATTASLNRRTSAGIMGGGLTGLTATSSTSSLPRAAGRIVSGTRDIAAAGATAAMNRRA
ncbi:cmgc dyrk dyrk2 kinase [Trichoderma arundinaceum]|uniref:dual-specificity kinase n=1 Tax=Trichoderma arundinaceum TaxID=490622 RepID=A0A395NCS2_TRIAR|nr:cmgc dyrk dyrk2 kinase [Trichoderma arundinaceum]